MNEQSSVWPHPHPGFAHLLPSREKATPQTSQSDLLPWWEKVPEGRMRGRHLQGAGTERSEVHLGATGAR
jgi:hypothetical protein